MNMPPLPPLYHEQTRIDAMLGGDGTGTKWDKRRCVSAWAREIHRLKQFPVGGLPDTPKARDAMKYHAEAMKRAQECLDAWTNYDGAVAQC